MRQENHEIKASLGDIMSLREDYTIYKDSVKRRKEGRKGSERRGRERG